MKKEDLFEAVTEIDDRHIAHAAQHRFRRPFAWKNIGALAACGVLAIGLTQLVPMGGGSDAASSAPASAESSSGATVEPSAGIADDLTAQDFVIPSDAALHLLSQSEATQAQIPAFVLFFNENHYFLSEFDNSYTIRPYADETISAPCGLTITHDADITPEAAAAQQLMQLAQDYQTAAYTDTAVRTDDISLHAENGSLQCDVSVVSDGDGGVFILTARYTDNTAQTHGLYFSDMTASFYAVSDPDALPGWLTALQETALEAAADLFAGQETDTQSAYGIDVREDLSIASTDYTVDTPLAPTHAVVSIEHRIGAEDSFSYLTLELAYDQNQWTVTFAGLEK